VYRFSKNFPEDERFGLTSQIRRSAVSVAANIAEGFSRQSANDKKYFYTIALGSLTETLSHSYIAYDLGFIDHQTVEAFELNCTELQRMINGMIKTAHKRVF
jgi:four helix bundle protein